ncbi:MAG: tetratricopeptide repeat protein [Candidatus Omnitrophica bacterium]|nr:tetratricopeptide repeat protein [Candidatus Omnitrophota bacterium]
MKKINLILILIFASGFLCGCSNDQYSIEKRYWQIQRQSEKIFKNPHATPPMELERVVKSYNNFIQKYPNNSLSVQGDFEIARLYIVVEEYEKARTQLRAITNKYKKSDIICAEAVFLAGKSYQLQDRWPQALEQYRKLIQQYPTTIKGLDVPVYIAEYYRVKFQPDKMLDAYKDAEAHYNNLAEKYPNSPLAYIANKLAAQCYVTTKDWDSAISAYSAMLEKYRGKVDMSDVLMDMALIYARELKDQLKSKETLGILLKDYPKSRFTAIAAALLKESGKNDRRKSTGK